MSKVLVDRDLLERTVKHLDWDGDGSQTVMQYAQQGDSLAGELEQAMTQPAEAEGVADFDPRCLDKWLRQYCHNDGSPGFVFGYEAKGTEQLVDQLRAALSAVTTERDRLREALNFSCKSLCKMTSSDGSGHADIALGVLRLAGVGADEREALVNGWKANVQWRIDAATASKEADQLPACSGCGAKGWTGNCLACIPY